MKKTKTWKFLIIIFVIVFIGLWANLPASISYEGVQDFDWWSNDIMISDMMYAENYEIDNLFLYAVTPSMLHPQEETKALGIQPKMFRNNEYFEKDQYKQYTSNIVIQRFLFRFLVNYLPVTHSTLLEILYGLYCLLSAIVITMFFYWISSIAGKKSCVVCSILLVAFCPYFSMYGKNLYWSMWSLFLPMGCMALVAAKGHIRRQSNIKEDVLLFSVSFFTCALKLLICFEFMTSVMVGMTIPIFYVCIRDKYSFKDIIKKFFWPFVGAMLSFFAVFGIKIVMLCTQYGREEAISLIKNNLGMRIFGTVDVGIKYFGPVKVSILMLSKEFMSIKGAFKITFAFSILLCFMIFLLYLTVGRNRKDLFDDEYTALIYSTMFSVLAPLSWFVMAAPHTTIHSQFATINWFIPYGILFIVTCCVSANKIRLLLIK